MTKIRDANRVRFVVGHTYGGSKYLGNGWWLRNGRRGHASAGRVWHGHQTRADALEKSVHPKPRGVPAGSVILTSPDPVLQVRCSLGDAAPLLSEGYGGWQPVDRPRRAQQAVWQGRKLFKLVFPIIFNEWHNPDPTANVEHAVWLLEQMARKWPGKPSPPLIQIDGGGAIPHDVVNEPNAWWVLDDIAVTDQEWNNSGRRNRYIATLTFFEYEGDVLVSAAQQSRAQSNKPAGAKKKTYTVRDGDKSLLTIAARELGDSRHWHDIARLNGIHDPRSIHPGEVLKMP